MLDQRPRALIIDDEENICYLASTALRLDGWEVEACASGAAGLASVERIRPSVIVLDVMLGDMDGFELCELLRRRGVTSPIVFLTARGAAADRVRGLTTGGDDYLVKPFSVEELVARCRLRVGSSGAKASSGVLRYADLEIDERALTVTRAGKVVDLSPTEYRLLHYLLLNAEVVLTRSQMLTHVWGYDTVGETSNLESYISFLRRKVDAGESKLIQTVRGFGYVLRSERQR